MEDLTKILSEATNLFMRYGLKSVTMSDLARQLGMSKKTLYTQVENKADLIQKVIEAHLQQKRIEVKEIEAKGQDAIDILLWVSASVHRESKDVNPSLVYDLQRYYRESWELIEAHKQSFLVSFVQNNLEQGIREGLYRAELQVKLITKMYMSITDGFIQIYEEFQDACSLLKLHDEIMNYHIRGIASEKGLALLKKYSQDTERYLKEL